MRFTLLFTLIFLLFNLHDVNAQCVAKAGLNDTICAGGSVTLGGTSTGNGTITYAWTPSAGLSCDDCASPIATPSSTTTYHLTITDSDGCSSSDDVTVVVNPLPNSGFTFSNNNVCANLPIVFTANSIIPGYSYSWNFGNPASGGNNTASTATTIHEFVSYGTGSSTFTVTLTVTTPQGCQTSTTQTVTINNLPQATLMDPISSFKNCDGTNFNMTIYDATPNTGTNYQIIWGDGTSDYNSTTAPSGESHTYTISDIFDLYYIVTGTNGCIDTAQYIVSNITNPAIGAANPGATTGCGPLTLCFPLSSYSANHHSTIYIVDYGDNTPVDTFTHAALPPQICHTYTESSCGKPGNAFTFEIQAQNQCDISTTTVTPIRIYTGPQPEFANPPVACVNTPVSFTNNTIPGYNTTCATTTIYTWDFGDGTANLITPIKTNPTHTYTSPGTYTITLSSQNSCGTFSIAHTICIEAIPNPLYDITPLTSCVPFNVVVTNNSDTADMCEFTFNWQLLNFSSSCQSAQNFSFDNGTTATTWHPQFLYESAGEYTMRLSITNSCGTFNKDTLVKGLDIPRIALAPLDSICLGNSVTPNLTLNDCYDPINTYSWTFNSGTPTASSDENPGPISYTMSGTFPITVEVTNICGSVDSTKTITVFDPPVADAGPDVSYCSGGSAVLGGATAVTGVSYQWSPTTNLTSTNQPTATANPTNTGDTPVIIQYVLTASTASTCLDRDTVNVTVNPLPHLTVNNPTICLGDNTQLIVSATTTPMNYLWNTTADLSCLPCDNPTLSPSVTTTYTVVATNSFGCIDSISSTVTVNPLPVVNAGNDSTLCDQPIPFNLTGTPAGGSWSGSVNVTAGGTFTPNGAEVATLVYSYTDPVTNCTNTDTAIVTVQPPVTPTFNPTDSVCLNDGIVDLNTIYAPSHAGGTWSGTGVTSPNFNPLTAGVGTHTLTYTYGTGTCLVAPTVDIIVHPNPTITANNATICVNDTAALLASGAGVGGTYLWTPNTALSCDNCANPQANPTATTTYTVTGTTILGCSSTTTAVVTVNPLPVVNAGADQTVCDQPIPFTLTGTPAGGTWSGSANVTSAGVFTPNGPEVATLVYAYTIPATGCSNTDTVIVTVQPPVTPTFNPTDSLCLNDGVVNLNTVYAPSHSGGTWSGTGVTSPNFNPLTAGVGTHTLTYTYGTGTCLVAPTVDIIVHPNPTITANNATICVNDTAALLASGAGVGGTYLWTPNTALSCDNCANPQANPTATTTYTVTGTTILGCSSTATAVVTVNPLPVVNAGADQTVCDQPIPFTLTGTPAGGTWSGSANVTSAGVFTPNGPEVATLVYAYTIPATGCSNTDTVIVTVQPPVTPTFNPTDSLCLNDGVVNLNTVYAPSHSGGTWSGTGVTSPNFNPLTAGVGTHTLTYTYGTGTCLVVPTVDIIVHPNPTITSNNATICVNDTAALLASGAGVGGTYLWTPNTALSCDNCANPQANPTATTTYTVTGTTILGCSSTATAVVTVNPLPVVNAGADTTLCNQAIGVQFNATPIGGIWSGQDITPSGLFTPSSVGVITLTYTYTIAATGCEASDNKIVTVVNPAQANAGLDQAICAINSTVQVVGTPATGTWSGVGVDAAGNFTTATVGNFELVYTNGLGNCLTRDTMYFTVHPLPIVNAGSDVDICVSSPSITFNATPTGGVYAGTGIVNTTTGEFNPTIATVGAHTIVYTYTDANTCVNDDSLVINVRPLPVVDFDVDSIVCLNTSVPFTNNSTLIAQANWDFGDGATSNAINPTHTYIASGIYTVQLVVTSPFGCVDSISKNLEVYVPPVAAFVVTPDSLCGPLTATFTNNSTGPDVSYLWDFGNGTTSTVANPPAVVYPSGILADTTYTISLTVSNYCGQVTTQNNVIVMPQPVAVFGTNFNSYCSPWTPEFANTSYGLPDTYSWDFGNGTTSNTADALFQIPVYTTGTDTTSYTITLTVTNECGTSTAQHTITVLPNTVNSFFNTSVVEGCENLSVDFTQYTLGSTSYHWDFGDGNTSTDYSPSHTFTQAGTYNVSLMVTNGCSFDTTTVPIVIHPSPNLAFIHQPDSVCNFSPIQFINQSDVLSNYAWTFGDGATSNITNPTHTYTTPGDYTVTLTGTSLDGYCTASATEIVHINAPPTANFTLNPSSGCVPLIVQFNNQSVGAAYSYWDFGDGNTTVNTNPQHTFTTPGTYTIQLIVQGINGCSDTLAQFINVNPVPTAAFSYQPTGVICGPNIQAQFTNASTGAVGYEWSFGDGGISNLTNPNYDYLTAGTFTIQLIAINQFGCKDTAQQVITIHQTPVASFTTPSVLGCQNNDIPFTSTSQFADSLIWNFGDGNTANGTAVTHSYSEVGSYTVSIIAIGSGGCSDTMVMTTPIDIQTSPIAAFTYETSIENITNATVIFTNQSTNYTSSVWDFGNGESSTETNPIHNYYEHSDFFVMLVAINDNGCTDTVELLVKNPLQQGLFVPNAVSPSHSDYEVSHFLPKGIGLKDYHVQIYDDWGNLIWESTKLDELGRPVEGWDGTYRGEPVQQDAYVWKISATFLDESIWEGKEYPKGKIKKSGTVTVIR